jgi:hypothetical protein
MLSPQGTISDFVFEDWAKSHLRFLAWIRRGMSRVKTRHVVAWSHNSVNLILSYLVTSVKATLANSCNAYEYGMILTW